MVAIFSKRVPPNGVLTGKRGLVVMASVLSMTFAVALIRLLYESLHVPIPTRVEEATMLLDYFVGTAAARRYPNTSKNTTSRLPTADTPVVVFASDVAHLGGKNLTYRYPARACASSQTAAVVMVGVLSSGLVPLKRQLVRDTWAYHRTNVFFLVAGPWTEAIHTEFMQQADLIWIDMPEDYRSLTEKVQVLLHAFHSHCQSTYDFVMKTDDDSYVRLDAVERTIRNLGNNDENDSPSSSSSSSYLYWGACQQNWIIRDPNHSRYVSRDLYDANDGNIFYPVYAVGAGYILANKLVACVLGQMQQQLSFPVEDAHTGVHVHACHGACTNSNQIYNDYSPITARRANFLVMHHVPSEHHWSLLHKLSCCSRMTPDPVSCRGPVQQTLCAPMEVRENVQDVPERPRLVGYRPPH
jgi:hypothetical protein